MNVMAKMGTGLFRGTWMTAAAMSLAMTATSAYATCGFTGTGSASAIRMPMLQAGSEAMGASTTSAPSIVGLWGVIYTTAGGAVFNQTFDTWHADGTEFENAYLPILAGNICEGVWKSTGTATVRLHHIGWTYDPVNGGVADGTFTLDQTNTLARNGQSYTGTFVFKVFDMKGKLLQEVPGTIAAVRISVE
jgi:hypothetical protein